MKKKKKKNDILALTQEEEAMFPLVLFILFRPSTGWVRLIHKRESNLLYSEY